MSVGPLLLEGLAVTSRNRMRPWPTWSALAVAVRPAGRGGRIRGSLLVRPPCIAEFCHLALVMSSRWDLDGPGEARIGLAMLQERKIERDREMQ